MGTVKLILHEPDRIMTENYSEKFYGNTFSSSHAPYVVG